MVNSVTTFALGALMTAFAIYAVMLNEAEHVARRRGKDRRHGERPPEAVDLTGSSAARRDGRRLPVGDFLFGALLLRGEEPLPFAELADTAAASGLDVGQTLTWLARAEESGLVERMAQRGREAPAGQPAVRLTEAGMDLARNNRRAAPNAVRTGI